MTILRLKAVSRLPFESNHEGGRHIPILTSTLCLLLMRDHFVVNSNNLVIIELLHLLKDLDAFTVS